MADFYQDMAQMARDLLSPTSAGGLGQGVIKLIHIEEGVPDPNEPWVPVAQTKTEQVINGAVRGIDRHLVGQEVGGCVILESDRVAITEVPSITYKAGDILSVDTVEHNIISIEKIPAAGITAAVKFIIRG